MTERRVWDTSVHGDRMWTTSTPPGKNNTHKRMAKCHTRIEKISAWISARGISSFIVASRWYAQMMDVRSPAENETGDGN